MRLLDIEPAARSSFDGRDITRLSRSEMRPIRREMMMVFQDPYASLNGRKRVGFIVAEPLEVHGIGTDAERKRRVQELLEVVGLNPEHYNRFPHEFSGGQRQRIGIARALAVQPEADRLRRAGVRARRLGAGADPQPAQGPPAEFGLTYVFIAHDLNVVRHISDRVMVMYLGKVGRGRRRRRTLYTEPKHPYTGALLSAVPIPDPTLGRAAHADRARGRRAEPDQPARRPAGSTRAARASTQGVCDVDEPQLRAVRPRATWPPATSRSSAGR